MGGSWGGPGPNRSGSSWRGWNLQVKITKGDENEMKKYLLGAVAVMSLFCGYKVFADGSYVATPGPVISATGQNYSYPNAQAPAAGGLLVQNGPSGTLFNWSNAVVTTTTSLTVNQLPTLPSLTLTQLNALTPATTGQIVFCSNCTSSSLCVSSGSVAAGSFVAISSATGVNKACN